ncbi:hypothetical protein KC669_00700 [Candidatus Dojkabacteria bacterium]|uniref:Uncharacterized protein n=1 Tax=Candidatus Dojkabacteria bacterium TaxID=2099670 RepID=A0A955RLB5_9BACT|nr:hypothetical protein [Candidatus Dojkabacteria bacterium]
METKMITYYSDGQGSLSDEKLVRLDVTSQINKGQEIISGPMPRDILDDCNMTENRARIGAQLVAQEGSHMFKAFRQYAKDNQLNGISSLDFIIDDIQDFEDKFTFDEIIEICELYEYIEKVLLDIFIKQEEAFPEDQMRQNFVNLGTNILKLAGTGSNMAHYILEQSTEGRTD